MVVPESLSKIQRSKSKDQNKSQVPTTKSELNHWWPMSYRCRHRYR